MAYEHGGNCWNCGHSLTILDYGRADICLKCGRDTKVCKGCEFYDPAVNKQCRETQADLVVDKERSNFCDYFRPKGGIGSNVKSREDMRSAADSLFKKKN